jgi:selenocysteine lyase/cysteine desulfurase
VFGKDRSGQVVTSGDAHSVGSQPLAEVIGAGTVVPLVQGGEARYVNLDYAATAPSLAVVTARVLDVLPWYSSVHRGSGYLSQVSTSLYEASRATVHGFLGARPDDVVVFTRNTTEALNLLATAVPGDGEITYLDIEHHANLLPWQRRRSRCIAAGQTIAETLERITQALDDRPAALLAITGASNVTGETLPLATVVQLAHERGTRVAVDAAQLAPHRRIDLATLGADYLALSGHKCYAPFGAGVLVGRRDWLDSAPAHFAGGGAIERVTIAKTEWALAPDRHEGGTPNLIGAVALAEASLTLARLNEDGAIEAHETFLRERLLTGLRSLGTVRPLQVWEDSTDAVGIVAFDVVGHEAGLVAACLGSEQAIGVREGKFCAHPLIERINAGRNAVRASFGIGTTTDDVDRLVDALRSYLRFGPAHNYSLGDKWYTPDNDRRPFPFPDMNFVGPYPTPAETLR